MKNQCKHPAGKSLFVLVLITLLFGCQPTRDEQVAALADERDSLLLVVHQKDTALVQLTSAIDEIENNLAVVSQMQGGLMAEAMQSGELVVNKREEINRSIEEINALMTKNTMKIRQLQQQLSTVSSHNVALSRMVSLLVEHIMYKNDDLETLHRTLREKNADLVALESQNDALREYAREKSQQLDVQHAVAADKETAANMVYFLFDNMNALRKLGVIDRNSRPAGSFKVEYFKQADRRKTGYLPDGMPSPRRIIKLLTPHPANSYELVKDDRDRNVNIRIKDQKAFWSRSAYAVVETE